MEKTISVRLSSQCKMIYLSLILHAYQPPIQTKEILDKVAKECYSWIFEWIAESRSDVKINLNLSASLTEFFVKHKGERIYQKILEDITNAAKKGNIEFVGSAAYHPILPKLPDDEIKRQIELNNKINKEVFKELWNLKGFFPPEFAFAPSIANIIKEAGFEWALASERSYTTKNNKELPPNSFITVKGLPIALRSDRWSNEINLIRPSKGNLNLENYVNDLYKDLSRQKTDNYIIIGGDIETFGHHVCYTKESMEALMQTAKKKGMRCMHISELLTKFPTRRESDIYPGSQSTNENDYNNGEFFPLWGHSKNPIHKKQWELTFCAINAVGEASKLVEGSKDPLTRETYCKARSSLDKGLHSCQYWWANPLGNWSSDIIYGGAKELHNAITASKDCIEILSNNEEGKKIKNEAERGEKLYQELLKMVARGDH